MLAKIAELAMLPSIEAGFLKASRDNSWEKDTIGTTARDKKKLAYANSLHPLVPLPSYRVLESKLSFYTQAGKLVFDPTTGVTSSKGSHLHKPFLHGFMAW